MLVVQNLTKDFPKVRAVDDLSFELKTGTICGFVGPNGAGKTTTMRIVSTLEEPSSGEILVDGQSIFEDPYFVRRNVGFMPDHYGSYPAMQVSDYLEFYARAYDLKGADRQRRVRHIMDFTGLDRIADKEVEGLSKGMRQRLNLGRALLNDPKLLVLDEPAAGLDPRARVELRQLIKVLAENGKTVFISSHILTELGEMCDSLLIIDHGRLVRFGNFEQIQATLQEGLDITVRLLDPDRAERLELFLSERQGVGDISLAPNGMIRFGFAHPMERVPELMQAILAAGFPVVEFRPQALTMEEVFMKITEGEGDEA